jgi:putative redox protein
MKAELKVVVGDLQGKMHLTGKGHTAHEVPIDYPPPLGEDTGFTSLELLLTSLASCSAHSVQYALAGQGRKLQGIEVRAVGQRRLDQHPTVLERVDLHYRLRGEGLDQAGAEQAIRLAEEKLCPVWAMLKGSIQIAWTCSCDGPA